MIWKRTRKQVDREGSSENVSLDVESKKHCEICRREFHYSCRSDGLIDRKSKRTPPKRKDSKLVGTCIACRAVETGATKFNLSAIPKQSSRDRSLAKRPSCHIFVIDDNGVGCSATPGEFSDGKKAGTLLLKSDKGCPNPNSGCLTRSVQVLMYFFNLSARRQW